MIGLEQWMDVKDLHKQGLSQHQIARATALARNTVANLLAQPAPQPFQKPPRQSCLDPYKPYLQARWQQYGLRAPSLLQEIQAQGYTGSINLVQRFLKTLKQDQGVHAKATMRFETPPGQQAQVDWAHVGKYTDATGNLPSIYSFVMLLGFSRCSPLSSPRA